MYQGIRTGGMWSKKEQEYHIIILELLTIKIALLTLKEQEYHINILELLTIKIAVLTFSKKMKFKSVHIQVHNSMDLSYLLKIGEQSQKLLAISKYIMVIPFQTRDHGYCRAPPKIPESVAGFKRIPQSARYI